MAGNLEIIFCFRDRDTLRIRNALQSLQAQTDQRFSVLFIDYGSSHDVAKSMKALCAEFSFCRYEYVDSRGKMWSRAAALNYGILLSTSSLLFMADADLIFLPQFVEKARQNNTGPMYFPVGYLSASETRKAGSTPAENLTYRKSEHFAQGMLMAQKELLAAVNGYNNFYSLWGVEDNDLYYRLTRAGSAPKPADGVYLLHQYHPPAASQLPNGWVQLMKDYFENFREKAHGFRGLDATRWPLPRPAAELTIAEATPLRGRELFVAFELSKSWQNLSSGASLNLKIRTAEIPSSRMKRWSQTLDIFFRKMGWPLRTALDYAGQYPEQINILNRLYFFVKSMEAELDDYYIASETDGIRFIAVKK